jgi:UDP-N-acetylglucosamine 2-epimerase (non-hydrolysing)
MVAQVAEYFGITPDVDLDLMLPNQTLASLTARCLERLDETVRDCSPDCVIAKGDTTTVMVAGMLAFYHRLPFVHVEAGLRTGNMQSPWPEEFNRRVAGLVTSLHCAPTQLAAENLFREGVPHDQVHVTGNSVIDALLWTIRRERARGRKWADKYAKMRPRMVLITGHRRENFGGGFAQICDAISRLARKFDETDFFYPVHLNPNVQKPVYESLGGLANVHLVPPASYPEFVWLMDRSYLILTDSGGVQEEAPSLLKPVLVMRDTTERPEAVEAGGVELVGASSRNIVRAVSRLLEDPAEYARRQIDANPYGDGAASRRIIDLVVERAWEQLPVRIAA